MRSLTAGTHQVQWLLNCTLEAPSGLTPSWRHQRDRLYQLRPASQSPFSPTSSSCLLSPQSLGDTLPRIPGDIPHPCPMTIHGGIHKSHAPCLPLRPFCRFQPVVVQPLRSSPLYFFSSVPPKVLPPKIPYMFFSIRVRLRGILPQTVSASHPWKNKLQQKF